MTCSVAEAVAQQHRRLRQGEGAAGAELELAAREHAGGGRGAGRAALGQVDIDEGVARLRVDGRRDHAHRAFDARAGAAPGGTTCTARPGRMRPSSDAVTSARHSRRPPRIRRNSSWPGCVSAPTVAVRAEITPSSGESTRVCAMRSSSACARARAASTREAAVFSAVRYCVICCLAEGARGPQLPGAVGVRHGLGGRRLRLDQRRARLRQLGRDGVVVDAGEDLALLHLVADVRQHLRQAEAADLRADDRFLPGRDVAVGGQHLRPLGRLRRDCRHAQRRLGRVAGPGGRRGVLGAAGKEPDARSSEQSAAAIAAAAIFLWCHAVSLKAQVGLPHAVVVQQLLAGAAHDDAAVLQHVGVSARS